MKRKMRHVGLIAALFTFILANTALADTLLYQQASAFPNSTVLASQDDLGGLGNFATMYDDFTLSSTASIDKATWAGGWFNGAGIGSISSFTVGIWADASGTPGSLLFSSAITGNAQQTLLGVSNLGVPTYSYSATFAPFAATAGSRYWISIVANVTSHSPQWGWDSTSNGGDSVQDFFGTRSVRLTDLTFALYDAPISAPEPGSFVLLACIIPLIAGAFRLMKLAQ